MAILSLNHSFMGRSTQAAGSASPFVRYIPRPDACTVIGGVRMPTDSVSLKKWRENAWVINKVIVAIPLGLSHARNKELAPAFAERLTEGRAVWVATIRDRPKDTDNPRAYIIRDRDCETSKRVMLTAEKSSMQLFRDGWEQQANIALERAGRDRRIDKCSLEGRSIDREPQIHVGAGAEKLVERDYQFCSNARTRIIDSRPTTVTVNHAVFDDGQTRFEENEGRKQRNTGRAFPESCMGHVSLRE